MKLIIGGSFQGKTAYAKEQHPDVKWVDGRICGLDEVYRTEGIHHFHEYIRRVLQEGQDTEGLAERLIDENPELIIVTNELGYGIVPIDSFDRRYRETTGRICTRLAEASRQVVRVICGVGQVIKG